MLLYPDVPRLRVVTIVRDAIFVLCVCVAIWAGHAVQHQVLGLTALTSDVRDAGRTLQHGFDAAGDSVDDAPVIGDRLARPLRNVGDRTGGRLISGANRHEARVRRLAWRAGVGTSGALLLIVVYLYAAGRVRQVRRLRAAVKVLGEPRGDREAYERAVAMRAAFHLPYSTLLRYTRDPLGDIAAGRHDQLIAAVLEESGLRVRGRWGD